MLQKTADVAAGTGETRMPLPFFITENNLVTEMKLYAFMYRSVGWKPLVILATAVAFLQFADMVSTAIGLSRGAVELNPLGFIPLLKLASAFVLFAAVVLLYHESEKEKKYWAQWVMLIFLVTIIVCLVFVVINNLLVIHSYSI